ncbi:MAG: DUF4292 domain-containing protein [Deltaproteobacteria bacterium]|jgi:outer membrane lipoprotein-sorting protein|nr:DUF4292 domain-containing protein [Deltaproteobacteria bacterium]
MKSLKAFLIKFSFSAMLLSIALSADGCVVSTQNAQPDKYQELNSEGPAMDLAKALYDQGQRISTFAARGEINYIADDARRYFRFEILTRRPGSFIFTIFDPFGQVAFKVISDGTNFSSLNYGALTCTVGSASSDNLGRVLPINLKAGDLISLLTGSLIAAPIAAARDNAAPPINSLTVQSSGNWPQSLWRLALSHDLGSTQIASFSVSDPSGFNTTLDGKYGNFSDVPLENKPGLNSYFPHNVDVRFAQNRTLSIRYSEVRLGVPLSEEIFAVQVPSGFTRIDI